MHTLKILLQILSGSLGVVLIYFGLFLYEDEDKKIRNYLTDTWLKLDDKEQSITIKLNNFIVVFTGKLIHFVNWLYGEKIVSLKSFGTSICLSLVSLFMMVIFIQCFFFKTGLFGYVPIGAISFTLLFIVFVKLSRDKVNSIDAEATKWSILVVLLIPFVLLIYAYLDQFFEKLNFYPGGFFKCLFTALFIVVMISIDYTYILICRLIFTNIVVANKLKTKLLFISINTGLLFFILIPPTFFNIVHLRNTSDKIAALFWGTNIYILILVALHTGVLLGYFFNLILWQIIKRPLYGLQEKGVFNYRKVFTAIGLFFLGLAGFSNSIVDIISRMF